MSKIQTSVVVPVKSLSEARNALKSNQSMLKAKIDSDLPTQMILKRGSQAKMRLLGGAFIKDIDLPIKAEISFNTNNDHEVYILVSENIVVGATFGMRDKLQKACRLFAEGIDNIKRANVVLKNLVTFVKNVGPKSFNQIQALLPQSNLGKQEIFTLLLRAPQLLD